MYYQVSVIAIVWFSSILLSESYVFNSNNIRSMKRISRETTALMGMLDNLNVFGSFLNSRDGDFVKLDRDGGDTFGPGPAILLVDCPRGISSDEIQDMIEDGAPTASKSPVSFYRMESYRGGESLLDKSVQNVFELIAKNEVGSDSSSDFGLIESNEIVTSFVETVPLLYFSSFSNEEMLDTFRIISAEIFEETGGAARPACAKFVQPAASKPLRQVIDEIRGDHLDATRMTK